MFKIEQLIIIFTICAFMSDRVFSLLSSSNPDGLEWAITQISRRERVSSNSLLHTSAEALQEQTGFLPDYSFKAEESNLAHYYFPEPLLESFGTSISGIIGSLLTFSLTLLIGGLCYSLKSGALQLKTKTCKLIDINFLKKISTISIDI